MDNNYIGDLIKVIETVKNPGFLARFSKCPDGTTALGYRSGMKGSLCEPDSFNDFPDRVRVCTC